MNANQGAKHLAIEPKTVELMLSIGESGVMANEAWVAPSESPELIEEWLEEAQAGQYRARVYQIQHQRECYERLIHGPVGHESGCQCAPARGSSESRPLAEYYPSE